MGTAHASPAWTTPPGMPKNFADVEVAGVRVSELYFLRASGEYRNIICKGLYRDSIPLFPVKPPVSLGLRALASGV